MLPFWKSRELGVGGEPSTNIQCKKHFLILSLCHRDELLPRAYCVHGPAKAGKYGFMRNKQPYEESAVIIPCYR
jgi:hypothetical protein